MLDETTNHLDKETINIISDRISNLTDTIIIDHNQDFINTLKNKIRILRRPYAEKKASYYLLKYHLYILMLSLNFLKVKTNDIAIEDLPQDIIFFCL